MQAGDALLLCSDGLTEMVDNDTITAVLAQQWSAEAAATELVARANDAGGRDNITVVLVRFDTERE